MFRYAVASFEKTGIYDITGPEYRRNNMSLGIDTETVSGVPFTGLDVCAGDLIEIKFTYSRAVISSCCSTRAADRTHVFIQIEF